MTKNKIFKNITVLALTLIIGLALFYPIIVSATVADDYANAQAELDKINKELDEIKDLEDKQQASKNYAEDQVELLKEQIEILNKNITESKEDLLNKQLELSEKKEDIQQTDDLFKQRLKAMYMMNNNSSVATVLGVDSFSQVLTASDTYKRISVADTELLKNLAQEKIEIEEEEKSINEKLLDLQEKQAELDQKTEDLISAILTINSNLSKLEAQEEVAKETQKEAYAAYIIAKEAVEAQFENGSTGEFVGGEWIWPVPTNSHISSPFGPRVLFGVSDNHIGIDISTGWGTSTQGPNIDGQPIKASNSGVVKTAIYSATGYGNYIIIDHGGNNFTLYGHCKSLAVGVGDVVTQGATIAYVGNTGNSYGSHLHFEIRLNGTPVDPLPYVQSSRP